MSVPFPPGFSGIDPELMGGMIAEFRRGRADIAGALAPYRTGLAAHGVDTSGLTEADRVCAWIDEQLPMLTRRRDLAIALDDSSEPGMASVDESLILTPAQARRMGVDLAARFRAIKHGSYHDILNELGVHRFDADYAAAFFAGIGADATRRLPALINEYGRHGHVARQLQESGEAFGSAVSGGMDVPGFSAIAKSLFDPNLSPDDRRGVATLVSYGSFPPEWLASLARVQALDPLYKQGTARPDFHHGDLNATDWETVQRMMQALAHNPAAARLAFQGVAGAFPTSPTSVGGVQNHPASLSATLQNLTTLTGLDPGAAEQFGHALAAGSGAYDEQHGHSQDAARFAFTVMTALPKVQIAAQTRISLSQIAGSYAPEIAEGANIDDRNQDTAFGKVQTFTPGLKPLFSLSPEDTYAFLKTFADSPADMRPFEQGMGELTRRLFNESVRIEVAKQHGRLPADAPGLERVMQALGYVSGLQTQAEHTVQGALDERDAERRDKLRDLADLGFKVGDVFVPTAGEAAEEVWGYLTEYGGKALDQVKDAADENTRIGRLEDRDLQMSLGLQHAMILRLIQGGYAMKVKPLDFKDPHPGWPFHDDKGRLLPYEDLAKDPERLANYVAWLEANGRGGEHETDFGQVGVNASGAFSGKSKEAGDAAKSWEKG
ncbi:hypothetical protein J4573_32210 [Actinomadura barringtoniae]|uniref:Uncharacterized protein n=1 Tax=Actinomadura barringtoniae TaxID=1427535 RepID=A0A939PFX3_9ACTN|nr:hypothetical protein [Actinomadura barringtoniae]MBO2451790.1 hypothetical protein [Actinomadura barringtoniae]